MDFLQNISHSLIFNSLLWGLFLLVFFYEVRLSKNEHSEALVQTQDRLKFAAAPLGTLLMISFGLRIFFSEGTSILRIIGLVLLVILVIISSTLIPKYFKANERKQLATWLIIRDSLTLASCVLFFL